MVELHYKAILHFVLGGKIVEKKTIGKFISALRRANGMTQKELGERLFVSDKTVSRWERDECTPELSLIPAISEIFGITTDELLRGERNSQNREEALTDDILNKQKLKSDKQFKIMLHNSVKKYNNLTFISIGISILALIAAIITNLGFAKGLIGFCLATVFIVASEICQICFSFNSKFLIDEEETTYLEQLKKENSNNIKKLILISFINIAIFSFCLPLVTLIDGVNYGMGFISWIKYGLLFLVVALVLSYLIYTLLIKTYLIQRETLIYNEHQLQNIKENRNRLVKLSLVAIFITLILGIIVLIINIIGIDAFAKKQTFNSVDEFKSFMEKQYDEWYDEGYGDGNEYYDSVGNIIIKDPDLDKDYTYTPSHPFKRYGEIKDSNGNIICEYYYNPNLYKKINFNDKSNDKMPVQVYTKQAFYEASKSFSDIQGVLCFLMILNFIVCTLIYVIVNIKNRVKIKK